MQIKSLRCRTFSVVLPAAIHFAVSFVRRCDASLFFLISGVGSMGRRRTKKKHKKTQKKNGKKNEAHPHGVVFSPVFPAAVIGAFYRLIATITRSDDIVDYRRRNKSADGCRSKKTNGISTTITSSNVVLFGFIRVRNEFMKLINNFSMISNISESRRF